MPGYGPPLQPTLYGPFEFTVGSEADLVRASGTWSGDLVSTARTGTVFGARRVLSITRAGAGVKLELSTSDPSGRRLSVTIEPGSRGVFVLAARPTPAAGVVGIGDTFLSTRSEAFHGFGGMHLGLEPAWPLVLHLERRGERQRVRIRRAGVGGGHAGRTPTARRPSTTRRHLSCPRAAMGSCF